MARELGTKKAMVATHGAVSVMKFCVSFRVVGVPVYSVELKYFRIRYII